MTPRIAIAKLGPADIEATKALIEEYLEWTNIDMSFQHIEEELAGFPKKYDEPAGSFLVAKDEGVVVGCVGFKKISEGTCEMKRLFVKERYRGAGLGAALVDAIIMEAEQKRYLKMRLDTLARMRSAVQLYKKCGFREIGQYVENPMEDAIFMERDLKPRNA